MKEETLKKVIQESIQEHVNGKIDKMDKKLDAHIEEMRPLMDLIEGAVVMRKVVLWFTSFLIALGSVYLMWKQIWK